MGVARVYPEGLTGMLLCGVKSFKGLRSLEDPCVLTISSQTNIMANSMVRVSEKIRIISLPTYVFFLLALTY